MKHNIFGTFRRDFSEDIAPYYEAHENSFDAWGIHGREHISRALVFGECMAKYYAAHFNLPVDIQAVRIAIAFHDAGREGNAKDVWEQQSADLCCRYLLQKGELEEYAQSVASFISHKAEANGWGQIVYDADVLEIMRLFCHTPNGFDRFRKKELCFLGVKDVLLPTIATSNENDREQLIQEAWELINRTEDVGAIRLSNNYLSDLVEWIGENAEDFPLIWKYLTLP